MKNQRNGLLPCTATERGRTKHAGAADHQHERAAGEEGALRFFTVLAFDKLTVHGACFF